VSQLTASPPRSCVIYLSNPLESGNRYYKLLLSQTDNASLKALIKNNEQRRSRRWRVTPELRLVYRFAWPRRKSTSPRCVAALAKLVVVDIALKSRSG